MVLRTRWYIHKYDHSIFLSACCFPFMAQSAGFHFMPAIKSRLILSASRWAEPCFVVPEIPGGMVHLTNVQHLSRGSLMNLEIKSWPQREAPVRARWTCVDMYIHCTMYIEQIFISTAKYVSKINSPRPSPPPFAIRHKTSWLCDCRFAESNDSAPRLLLNR